MARLSTLSTSYLYPTRDISGTHSVRGSVKIKTIVRPKGSNQWEIPVTPSGMEPTTYRPVTRCQPTASPHTPIKYNWSCYRSLHSPYTATNLIPPTVENKPLWQAHNQDYTCNLLPVYAKQFTLRTHLDFSLPLYVYCYYSYHAAVGSHCISSPLHHKYYIL